MKRSLRELPLVSPLAGLLLMSCGAAPNDPSWDDLPPDNPAESFGQPEPRDQGKGDWPCIGPQCWHWHEEVVVNPDPYLGSPAWADDAGSPLADASHRDAAGVLLRYERRISIPALQGWWARRSFSYRVFTQNPDGIGKQLVTPVPLKGNVRELFYMRSAGYLLLGTYGDNGRQWVRVGLDGSATLLPPASAPRERVEMVPAPGGAMIAELRCKSVIPEPRQVPVADDGPSPVNASAPSVPTQQPCTVRFVDAATLGQLGAAATAQVPLAPHRPYVDRAIWTPSGSFILFTAVGAVAFAPGTVPHAVPLPSCQGPPTTSSRVAADGRRVTAWGGRLWRRTQRSDAPHAFGCP